ncbi:MAG: hypothetical protein SCK29_09895 [Bacillota bacterium]|nr:hypothetical protein [Bacillota bacterium]MDW7684412.1 hypothetical protein [Bacillota bacterium]
MNLNNKNTAIALFYILAFSLALLFHTWSANSMAVPKEDRLPVEAAIPAFEAPRILEPDQQEVTDVISREDSSVIAASQAETATEALPADNPGQAKNRSSKTELASRQQSERNRSENVTESLAPAPGNDTEPPPGSEDPPPPPEPKPEPEPGPSAADTELNPYVLDVIRTYTNGPYPYLLNTDYANYNGVTENIFYRGSLLAKAHPSGSKASHCSGITFEVFFKAMQQRNRKLGLDVYDFNGMRFDELHDFLLTWYVASGSKTTNNIEVAVEKYGLGTRISRFEEARRGDFMDISRSNWTGHTVVFLNWVRDDSGSITGLHYWSSQGSTNGIGEKTEYFDTSGRGNVLANQVYIARILPVHQYRAFR